MFCLCQAICCSEESNTHSPGGRSSFLEADTVAHCGNSLAGDFSGALLLPRFSAGRPKTALSGTQVPPECTLITPRRFDRVITLLYKVTMNSTKRILAATELLLVLPATLFMTSLFVRNLQPHQYEPARRAGRLVEWYAARPFLCLDVFHIAMPLIVFTVGCATLLRSWRSDSKFRQTAIETLAAVRAHLATVAIACATVVAGGILAVVAIHVITD